VVCTLDGTGLNFSGMHEVEGMAGAYFQMHLEVKFHGSLLLALAVILSALS